MVQPLSYLAETASQTAGPYVHIGLSPQTAGFEAFHNVLGAEIAAPDVPGERIRITGSVFDGNGAPVRDALIESWQADSEGRHPSAVGPFRGWGRIVPDLDTGLFAFETIRPGPVTARDGSRQAPHIALWIVARGINVGLMTRVYFPGDANATDPVLSRIEPHRRATLIAREEGPGHYRFDIRLQGADETVFFDV